MKLLRFLPLALFAAVFFLPSSALAVSCTLTLSSDTLNTFRTNVNSCLTNFNTAVSTSWPFPNDATSTKLTFTGGFLSLASTTVGDGTAGLTVSGNSTTTGNAYFNNSLLIGTTTNWQSTATNRFAVTGDTTSTSGQVVLAPGLVGNNRTLTLTGNTINASATANASAQFLLLQNNGAIVGIGTTTPYALLSIATKGDATGAVTTLFAIASSTNYASGAATSTLLALSNTGLLTFASTTNTSAVTNPYAFTQGLLIPNKPDLVTNFENASIGWQGNVFYVQTQPGGTGSVRALTLQALNNTGGSPAFITLAGLGNAPAVQIKSPVGSAVTGNELTTTGPTASSGMQALTLVDNSTTLQTGSAGYVLLDLRANETTVGTGSHYIQRWIASTTAINGLQGSVTEGVFTSAGQLGIGSTSPFARLSIHANNGDTTGTTLFAIGSSTASATTTLFSVSNTGSTTLTNSSGTGITLSNGTQNDSLNISSSGDLTFNNSGGQNYTFSQAGSARVTIGSSGAFGLASTTPNFTLSINDVGSEFYVTSTGEIVARDTANSWTGRLSPTHSFVLSTATTTGWTASTTASGYSPFITMPFAGTLRQVRCTLDQSFLGVNTQVNGSNATPSYFVASTTVGVEKFTAGNTFSAGQKILANFGTTTTAGTLEASCTFDVTETP